MAEPEVHLMMDQSREEQGDIAAILRLISGNDTVPVSLTAEEREAISKSKTAAARGEFASDEEVSAVWAKHGR